MTYEEYCRKTEFSRVDLVAHANGTLIQGPQPEVAALPEPPLLMLDRVTEIKHDGPRGRIVGEHDVSIDAWYFSCHFRQDPVQPGCLGVEAVWQLLGVYLTLRGAVGTGRALGCREVEFFGQIRPHNRVVKFDIDIRRCSVLPRSGRAMVIGTAKVFVDDQHVYTIADARLGAFKGVRHDANGSPNAAGGPDR
ncbi:MAG TPA: bifunctional 3-hydroxydecanoyl-ACP dehydratase/trans-2-decenoyl-ACP isomerase [Candidatus Solibacter sp.]|nr:bifunctional 3-hydroxydecanoyl-ACP dehydratase/trans-2-decenoyl-ACP isomerase [Candidatus Solibacter sp.]